MHDNISPKQLQNAKKTAKAVGMPYYLLREGAGTKFPYYLVGKAKMFRVDEVEAALQKFRVSSTAEVLS
jgi:hypothetical protein